MHPPIDPHDHGWLDRPDGARIHWEESGNPTGRPALYLHGGPGSGLGAGGYRQRFDPEVYRIIGLDQRGCGRSTPWAIDDLGSLDRNTTAALIEDVEALRRHLGVERWLLHGVSWGSTLALAYALKHPERVTEVVLVAVTTGSRREVDWITEGVGSVFPEAWARFTADVPAGVRPVEHHARLLRSSDPAVRDAAADSWDTWESTHVSLDPAWRPGQLHADPRDRRNFATLVTHYWANDCFLDPDEVLRRAGELAGIPGVLVHGRRDVSGPVITPWLLHRAWPGSRLEVVEDEGHGGPTEVAIAQRAIDGFARGSGVHGERRRDA